MAEKEDEPRKDVLRVMVSSTITDLPAHREQVKEACLRLGMLPKMMEHQPPVDKDAIAFSLALVDEADIYVGVYAHRYGYVPKDGNPKQISVTEMEYDRAVERGIPRLIYIIHDEHPITVKDLEKGKSEKKLKTFLTRVKKDNFANFFKSPEDLESKVIHGLSDHRQPDTTKLPYVRDIPLPPEEYIAHPYLLLQTPELIGRHKELHLLNQWVSEPGSDIYGRHIFSFVAIGGLGKSALTWQWFNEIAPGKMTDLAGRMWWSFYDPNADFENFVLHALAYVSDNPVEVIRDQISPPERETRLLAVLNEKPFLIVFDGFERVLNAYSRAKDAARIEDTDVELQGNARKTADPRVGQFLKKLAQVKNSRILISTRIQPAELENEVDDALPGVYKYDLESLPDTDAIDLWKTLGVEGARDSLLHLFRQFDKHTLLLQALAREVKRFREAPGDLEKWCAANPKFDPASYSNTKDRTIHVLEFPLSSLSKEEQDVLSTIVAFRNPPSYATLAAVLIGAGKPCADKNILNEILSDLEDRGLMGWNRRADRYEIHPVVRSVVWGRLSDDAKQGVYTILHSYFEAVPIIDEDKVEGLEDLIPAIELYNALIGMGRYDDAEIFFYGHLGSATLYRLSASQPRAELLEMLFPEGLEELPRLSRPDMQGYTLNALAQGYLLSGQPGRAAPLYRRAKTIAAETGNDINLRTSLCNLSNVFRFRGSLRESESAAWRALEISRTADHRSTEAISLLMLGPALATREKAETAGLALRRSLRILIEQNHPQLEGVVNSFLAEVKIRFVEPAEALPFANRAWDLAHVLKYEVDFIRAARMQGEAALGVDDLDRANERLHYALIRARGVNRVEEELPTLTALAELRRRQGDEKAAREFLDDVWEFAERGPYPTFQADALNVLAQIERDAGNTDKAIEAATKAYQLAWCDGPPYAYHWGLVKARKHLEELEAPLPDMPEFDESKFEPMPEVEIDPEDEFHVGESS